MSIQNTAAASLLVDVVRDLAVQGWKLATKKDSVTDSIEKVVEKAVDAALDALRDELRSQFAALGLAYDIAALADRPRDVLDAFDAKGEIKPLGLNITEVGPGETLTDTVVGEVPEPDK